MRGVMDTSINLHPMRPAAVAQRYPAITGLDCSPSHRVESVFNRGRGLNPVVL